VPLSPRISTVERVFATFSTTPRIFCISGQALRILRNCVGEGLREIAGAESEDNESLTAENAVE
jgi:hypothetical protein